MTKQELHDFMTANAWFLKSPHYTCYHNHKSPGVRYKVKKLALRKEYKNSLGEWHSRWSTYISKLEVSPDGKLRIKASKEHNSQLAEEFAARFA